MPSPSKRTAEGAGHNTSANEAQPQIVGEYTNLTNEDEKANGRLAIIGFLAAIGAYVTTGQLIPCIY